MTDYLRVPILNDEWDVRIVWGSPEEVNAKLRRWGHAVGMGMDEDYWDTHGGTCAHSANRRPVICLPTAPSLDPEILGVVAHEALHAVQHIFRTIEVEDIDEEIVAHSIGAIVRAAAKYAAKHQP